MSLKSCDGEEAVSLGGGEVTRAKPRSGIVLLQEARGGLWATLPLEDPARRQRTVDSLPDTESGGISSSAYDPPVNAVYRFPSLQQELGPPQVA